MVFEQAAFIQVKKVKKEESFNWREMLFTALSWYNMNLGLMKCSEEDLFLQSIQAARGQRNEVNKSVFPLICRPLSI